MFNDVNQCTLLGNITSDIEVRKAGDNSVTNFSVATNRRYKKDEEWIDEPTFHNVVVWGKQAETLERFAKKGTRIYLQGRMQTRTWDDKEGKKNYKTELVANEISLLARTKEKGETSEVKKQEEVTNEDEITPESLPF
jgi:single-strand DNA-binding protein